MPLADCRNVSYFSPLIYYILHAQSLLSMLRGGFVSVLASRCAIDNAIDESDGHIVHDWNGVWPCVSEVWICDEINIRKVRLRIWWRNQLSELGCSECVTLGTNGAPVSVLMSEKLGVPDNARAR
jgi:hypothetical protein